MTADNVIGIFTSRAMRERGSYQIQFMKTRSSSGVGQKVDLEFNIETLRITDPGEDVESSFNQQRSNSSTSNIVEKFKKTSTLKEPEFDKEASDLRNPDPTAGVPVGKIKATTDSSRIRAMLANINSEKD
jgi:hypothetical protein